MQKMRSVSRLDRPLPDDAAAAVSIAREVKAAGHVAVLAGGCVRDLLLGFQPEDYDVATDATPDQVCTLFRDTRKVGAQFGVVLVRKKKRWVEVATFRSDRGYSDGRRPDAVEFGNAEQDALRRDFTINGLFLDADTREIWDYVGGRVDIAGRVVRAIGEPRQRFEEDHLRLLRAVRFAARLGFEIEGRTAEGIRRSAPKLVKVAPERVRDELERMLGHATRPRALELLGELGLIVHLSAGLTWTEAALHQALEIVRRLPADATFEAPVAALLLDRGPDQVDEICRKLTFSNDQREAVVWLVANHARLDDPAGLRLAELKRLMARREFAWLVQLSDARHAGLSKGPERMAKLRARMAAIPEESVQPAPFVTGDDVTALGIPPGPIYKRVLDELYTQQLDEKLVSREQALAELRRLLEKTGPADKRENRQGKTGNRK